MKTSDELPFSGTPDLDPDLPPESERQAQPDARAHLKALLSDVDQDLALLRELRDSGASGDHAARVLQERDQRPQR
ncbi:hypothetical protein SAMN06264364_13243 [Quadrisphaera granulorum]|uniref:Uncharacterized protein n=1 Tax=Quadrisphaera granulorum TaxID=317664 RepID=A0A315ZSN6_9ACTN|nr:hypothetical protein [Quadrisphaera granulorum]PWJ48163.1 hypothetical protein BXY45_13243 [Quadrisphaera granulorum]SZE98532.1 hypothetical protein SAMN06264364_13243 [Quadrisphaera granulorum]